MKKNYGNVDSRILQGTGFDISFLESPLQEGMKYCGVQKSQFSLVICGFDEHHWVGWAFIDRNFEECKDLGGIDFPYIGVHEDPIASDLGSDILDANRPMLDQRL